MRLLLQTTASCRRIILSDDNYQLSFSRPKTLDDVVIDFARANNDEGMVVLNSQVFGTLGLINLGEHTFIAIVTAATSIGPSSSSSGSESIERIKAVTFYCLTSSSLDMDPANTQPDYVADMINRASDRGEPAHPCAGIRSILSSGSYYYSSGKNAFDLSTRLEERIKRRSRIKEAGSENVLEYDPRFLWNRFMVTALFNCRESLSSKLLVEFNRLGFIVLAIQGYAGVSEVYLDGQKATLSLISRVGSARAGTRFNTRGIDDSGNVANFVETETVLRTASMCLSYVQVRGSVPLFWEEGLQPFGKIEVTRPLAATLPAFSRHFDSLIDDYSKISILNLLSSKDQEALLTKEYQTNLRASDETIQLATTMSTFDFHAISQVSGIDNLSSQLISVMGSKAEEIASCLVSIEDGEEMLLIAQRGVVRTNCKDSLDRTNVAQDILSRFALQSFVRTTFPSLSYSDSSLWLSHQNLFASNGDALSSIYVGTGALNSSFTRSGKKSFAGLLSNATKSVGRIYQSNFVDGGKQKSIDTLLGNLESSRIVQYHDPLAIATRESLLLRAHEYTSHDSISLWIGTYNLNGKPPSSESLLPWIFPSQVEPVFFAISFQELVPLNPQQIMLTDRSKLLQWEAHLLQTISRRPNKKAEYIVLRSEQLVGTALIILVQSSCAHRVRNVEATIKKTGLKGIAGNKGAVAIRLDYCDSSFCFLTAHLAAGHSNVEERNADYFTIARGLHFQRGRVISSHDNVIWAADTNYRISLDNETVRTLAAIDDYDTLYCADQLASAMASRGVFRGFSEGPILFKPTYKYDVGTDIYDSSEKNRIPAYTDRILFSGQDLNLSRYSRAELFASDHRPVYALIRARIKSIDRVKLELLRTEIMQQLSSSSLAVNVGADQQRTVDLDLPPPSDDSQAWWEVGLLDTAVVNAPIVPPRPPVTSLI